MAHSEQTLYGKGCSNVNAAMSHKQFLRPAIDQSIFSMLSTDSETLRQKKAGQFQGCCRSSCGKFAYTTLGTSLVRPNARVQAVQHCSFWNCGVNLYLLHKISTKQAFKRSRLSVLGLHATEHEVSSSILDPGGPFCEEKMYSCAQYFGTHCKTLGDPSEFMALCFS